MVASFHLEIEISKNNREKFKIALQELIDNYNEPNQDMFYYNPTQYEDITTEINASLWERSYLKKYYPNSNKYIQEKRSRNLQKERLGQ